MKKLIYTSLMILAAGLVGTSCKKSFLDRSPQGIPTVKTFLTDSSGAVQSVNAIYAQLRNQGISGNAFVSIFSITSDDADKGSTAADGAAQTELDGFTISTANGMTSALWSANYTGIARANFVLDNIPAIKTLSVPLKNRLTGEAKCLRAFYYFNLVRAFGGVPIVDHVQNPDEYNLPKSTKDQVYAFINKDLSDAIALLPEKSKYPLSELGRVTKGAAKGLLAKVFLYQNNWEETLRLTNEIMLSGEYNLSTPYDQIFLQAKENGPESVFEIQAVSDAQNSGSAQYSLFQGIRISQGNGFNIPSTLLNAAYEPNDPRKAATILVRGQSTGYGETVPASAPNPFYNKKAYVIPTERSGFTPLGGGMNIRILRYSDIVLMNAEAANEVKQYPQALSSLNAVRIRARGSNPATVLPNVTVTDQTQLRTLIWQERRIELAMEHERFFDLVRTGRAGTVLRAAGKPFVDGVNELMPIPQLEIDNSHKVLIQNFGYN